MGDPVADCSAVLLLLLLLLLLRMPLNSSGCCVV
jgi:hypothetical protein